MTKFTTEMAMLTEACTDRSGDTERVEQMKELLFQGARELGGLRGIAERLVRSYDAVNPMRTADQHPEPCDCQRCLVDELRGYL